MFNVLLALLCGRAYAADGWTTVKSLQVARTNHAVVPLSTTRAFIAGGRTQGGLVITATEIFDAVSNGYVAGPTLLTPRESFSLTRLQNGKFLIAGGSNATGKLNSAELYDPVANTITPVTGSMSVARSGHSATLLPDGTVLMAGGGSAKAEIYNPATSSFTTTNGALPSDLTGHRAVAANGTAFIIGGRDTSGTTTGAIMRYDRTAGTFVPSAALFASRADFSATLLNPTTILVVGGRNGSTPLASAERYDITANSVTAASGALGTARFNHQAFITPSGEVIVSGGSSASASLSSCEKFMPASGTFSTAPALPSGGRSGHVSVMLDNRHFVAGGVNGTTVHTTMQVYGPSASNPLANVELSGGMATARQYHTATMLGNGNVLISGGYNSSFLSTAELYNQATGAFTSTGNMQAARRTHTGTLLLDDKVLITGGYNGSYMSSAEVYNPATGTFSPTGSMVTARQYHTATLLADGKVLITGGNYGSYLSSAELYDPAIGTFSPTGSMATARGYHTATLLADGKVLITGGYGNTYPYYLASAELYDPATGTFSPAGNMTTARQYHTATLLSDGRVLVTGGYKNTSPYYLASAELYDPATGTFSPAGSMATGRQYHTATLLGNGKVLITGGYNGSYFSSAEMYDPAIGTFSPAGSMATARGYHTATRLSDGTVLITGGYNWSFLNAYELFDAYSSFIQHKNITGGTFFSLQVRSVTSGQPIPGVSVSVDDNVGTQTTDANGYATFFIATPKQYNVSLTSASYLPVSIDSQNVSGYRVGLSVYMTPPALLNITSTALQPAQAGLAQDDRILFTGADWPYTISRSSGQLPSGMFLYPATGQLAGTPSAPGSFTFMVRIVDKDGWSAEREFTMEVSNPLKIVPVRLPRGTATQSYFGVMGADGGTAPYTFSISGAAWLSVDPSTGALQGTAPGSGTQAFTITLRDVLGRTTSQAITITIDQPLQLHARRMDDGITATSYSQSVTASGGLAPYTWSVYSGTLPAGLSLDTTNGTISGTPTKATRSVFVLSVSDAAERTAYRDYVVNITSRLQLVTTTLPNGYKGDPYSELVKVSGGLPPYTYSYSGQLPAGLTLDTATGVISGIPTIAGLTNLNISVHDGTYPTPQSVAKDLTSRIVTTLAITTTGALPNARKGIAINPVILAAKGGTSPYTWKLDSGILPTGLSLAGGVLSGTPTKPGDFVFTLAVTDSATVPATEKKQFICHVSDTLEIVRMDLPVAAVGVAYSQTLEAIGGIPASYSWRVNTGTLPSGLSFNPATATIMGTPTTRQSYSFTVEVSDGDFTPQVATRTFVIDVVDSLNIAEVTIPNGRLKEGYTTTLHPLRGNPPYAWRISKGLLPNGLALSGSATTAQITGKPTAYGIFSFDVEVSDSSDPAGVFTRRYTMEVYDTVTFQSTQLRTVVRERMYDESLVVTGGARTTVTSGIFDPAAGSFGQSESMWVNRQDYTATTLQNGKVLVVGGRSGLTALAGAELYDPATGAFKPVGDLATARYLHTATLLKNGKVLIAGGTGSTPGALASAELYNPATNVFTAVGNMNDNRVRHTATLLDDGRVLVAGGSDSIGARASAETFNPATSVFTPVGNLAVSRQNHTATLLQDKKVLIVGGDDSGVRHASAELFDPATSTFTTSGNMASIRTRHSSTLLSDGNVLLAGGLSLSGITAAAEIYNPLSNEFSATAGQLASARYSHSATMLDDGTVLIANGYNSTSGNLASAEQYDPILKTFRSAGSVGNAAQYQAAARLNDGKVFFPGGYNEQYRFSVVSGSLPEGILLDEKTGGLHGTTSWSAGRSTEVTFQVVDSGSPSQTAQQKLLFKVVDPLAITTANLTAQQNTAYSLALEATGGVSPYSSWDILPTWSTNNGNLPPGLVINQASGVISGTPTSCGVFPVRAKVVDSWAMPNQANKDFQFDVGCTSGKYKLLVQKEGTGSGTVTSSSPSGVSCGTTCGMELSHNSSITLVASPAAGSRFTGWSGSCSGTSSTCTISMGANVTATASFSLNLEPSGSITANGGSSFVKASPVPLSLSATSPLAAMSKMQFSVNQSPWSALVPYATNYSVSLASGDALYSIYVRFQDANGNYSPAYTASITLDTTKPLLTKFDVPGTSNSATVPVISFAASDLNGITGYYISTSSTPPAAGSTSWSDVTPLSYTVAGITPGVQTSKVLYAFVKDAAGNISLAANSTVVITIPSHQLSVTLEGTGSGAVNSSPSGIACTSGTCSAYFNSDTQVTVLPTPAWNSDFKGWSGLPSCATTGPCQVTINGMTALTALFDGKPSYLVWLVEGATSSAYYSLNDVFADASNGAMVLAPLNIFTEDVEFSSTSSKSVEFKGGYDPVFKQQSGYTVVDGTVTLGKGSRLVVERLVIQ